MRVETLAVGSLATNCHLAINHGEVLVIDPGDEGDFISQKILEWKLKPVGIIFTHGHFDHVLGAFEVKLNFGVPICLHRADLEIYHQATKSARFWSGSKERLLSQIDRFLEEGDRVLGLRVIETPGHTPGSISLYYAHDKILFSGDTLFKQGIGRTDHRYSSALKLQESLEKLFKLPPDTQVYPGHGELTTIGSEVASLNQ